MRIPSVLVLLAVTAVTARGAMCDPGEAAVRFLEKTRAGTLNLEPGGDTALASETDVKKRQEITRRLQRLVRDIGKDSLEVFAVKTDDNLAAVLVRNAGVMDPASLQVFPVALVKRDGIWLATPVPASFENSGLGYAPALKKRAASLQEWMLSEQTRVLSELREQAASALRKEIGKNLSLGDLKKLTPVQMAEKFLAACQGGDHLQLLALLGGLSATPASDWSLRSKSAARAVDPAAETKRPWRLLVSKDVLRVELRHTEVPGTARVSIACLDPAEGAASSRAPRIELVNLDLSKTPDGLWKIDPPMSFLNENGQPDDAPDENLEILDEFPANLSRMFPPRPLATAQEASHAVAIGLERSPLSALVPYIRFSGNAYYARKAMTTAARTWRGLRDPPSLCTVVPLALREDGDKAAGVFHFFSSRNPDRPNLNVLFFDRSAAGWQWTPQPLSSTEQIFSTWTETQKHDWETRWRDKMLDGCIALESLPDQGTPAGREESVKLMESWLEAIRAGNVTKALALTARLSAPDSNMVLLRNLGYEMTGNRVNRGTPTITGVHSGTIWTAVGTKALSDNKPVFPFYPIINTSAGPRILLEVDLCVSGGRGRDFLNKTSLERLLKIHPQSAEELKKLFSDHQSEVTQSSGQ